MTDDLISRAEAIEAFDGTKVGEKNCTEYDSGYNDGIDFAVSTLSVLPSAQQWIPCSERLPDTGKIVLVCGKMGGIYTAIYSKQRADWDNGWWKLNSKSHRCDPKAWMPLPKPYEEKHGQDCGHKRTDENLNEG